jgi:hypothetical protein
MIMEKVINKFFSNEIEMRDRKVFLVWANESWSKNVSFNNETEIIENNYSEEEYIKNIENLITYFKHNNYLKINNKPVFFIHHPWFMTNEQLDLFKKIINEKCISHNFNGCHLIINSMYGYRENFKHYNFHFNYKKTTHMQVINNQITLDYAKYIDNLENEFKLNSREPIKTLAFNFNNKARLYKPDKLKHSTITINNNETEYIRYINMVCHSYNESKEEIDKILLINSWNEWGEGMAIEPSNEKGAYYLDLLKNFL